MSPVLRPDAIVVGGGLVGSAIAYGLARHDLKVALLDEGDDALRASRGNFGLVWVQGKGERVPEYALWTRSSADLWPDFAGELRDACGYDIGYSKPGGLAFCMSDAEYEAREAQLNGMRRNITGGYDFRMIDRAELKQMLPHVGDRVAGASWCPHDGHTSPLLLLRALHQSILERAQYVPGAPVRTITWQDGIFRVETPAAAAEAPRLVLAAGLGNRALAPMVGLNAPVRPLKGQILVTERLRPLLDGPTIYVRQTENGSVMMGDSHEEAGLNTGTTPDIGRDIARRALAQFPILAEAQIVRTWAALRVMTPDGHPIYEQSRTHPGAFVATCHSGVTLAAAHARTLAAAIVAGQLPDSLAAFRAGRFAGRIEDQA